MAWTLDARIPVRLGAINEAGEGDALLVEGEAPAPGFPLARFETALARHSAECACCAPHGAAALALNQLFQARARGEVPFFRRVLALTATPEGDMAVWSALRVDPLAYGRFRLERD